MGKPAARITDMHTCPMVTGLVPHVGGPVVMGSPNVITGGLPQARVGDMLVCVGPPDVIAKGSSGVFVNGRPAARLGDQTAHGGVIVVGLPTVLIGEMGGGSAGGAAAPADGAALAFAAAEAQIKTLVDAAKTGTPFCEVCFQKATAAAKAAAAKMAAAKAPAPAAKKITPAATPPKAAQPPVTPAKPATKKNTVCELVSLDLSCSHGRKPGPSGILMVVPNSDVIGSGDKITGKLTMKGGCGDHAAWAVSGTAQQQGKGTAFSFTAKTWKPSLLSPLSLQGVSPQTYSAAGDACHGSKTYDVHAYPPGAVKFTIALDQIERIIDEIKRRVPIDWEADKEGWQADFLKGQVQYEGSWKEEKGSWQAYYEKAFNIGFSPLIGVSIKCPIYPLTLVPGWLSHWIKAGVFGEFSTGFNLSGTIAGKYRPALGKTEWGSRSVKGEGEGRFGVFLELKLVSPDIIESEIGGETAITLGAKLGREQEETTVEVSAAWNSLTAKATVKALYGIVEFEREFQVGPEFEGSHEWSLDKAEASGGGGSFTGAGAEGKW